MYRLPAPIFEITDKEDRIRACYLHCCLSYVYREHMNNASLSEKFGFDQKNQTQVGGVMKDVVKAILIKPYDQNAGTKAMRYVPIWA